MPQPPAASLPGTPGTPRHPSVPPLVLFATGSTGGHVSPALAVAEALQESGSLLRVLFVGPAGGVAERMVRWAGGEFLPLDVPPLLGSGPKRWVKGIAHLPVAAARSLRTLRKLRPGLVVGTGAHTSGPLLAMAALGGIPTLLFEANVNAGLTNRLLGPVIDGAAVAWQQALETFPGCGFFTGCPVSHAIRGATSRTTDSETGRFRLLVMGGSAGSTALDRAVQEATSFFGPFARRLSVFHQASSGQVEALRERYRVAGVEAQVETLIRDLAHEYLRANLVITRPGGITLAELGAVGRPAILVPLPSAEDHQRANALAWEGAGCSRTLLPHELTGEALAGTILALATDPTTLVRMGEAARTQYQPDAARRIADRCLLALQAE